MKFWFSYHVDTYIKKKLKIHDSIRAWNFIEVLGFINQLTKIVI